MPNKVVLDIKGKSMPKGLLRDVKNARKYPQSFYALITDTKKIGMTKIKVIMTSKECQSGSERIASVIDILVNEAKDK